MRTLVAAILAIINSANMTLKRVCGFSGYNTYAVGSASGLLLLELTGNPRRIGVYIFGQTLANNVEITINGTGIPIVINLQSNPEYFVLDYARFGELIHNPITVFSKGGLDFVVTERYWQI